ncbi:MAG TPA: MbtH family NRPS accessory protein [Acidimicrobiales bacterium]|nr:MbtH family NRPS accessory protein [Acidimicrobiales bacterium]
MGEFDDHDYPHHIVVNDEGMYSIWPVDLPVPAGWDVCETGPRESCLNRIEELWTDMRPRSARPAGGSAEGDVPLRP